MSLVEAIRELITTSRRKPVHTPFWLSILNDRRISIESSNFRKRFDYLARILDELHQSLPAPQDPSGLEPGEVVSLANPTFVHARFYAHLCTILLFNMVASESRSAYKRVLESAVAMAQLAQSIRGNTGLNPILAPYNLIVSKPLINHLCS
jgi:hypothetical protein